MDGGYITLNSTKNKQTRVIPIPSTLFVIFTECLRIRNSSREDYLFCIIFGEPLQRTALQCLVKRYSKKRGKEKYGSPVFNYALV